jgi:hypothetical protein
MKFEKIEYRRLNARQKENFNFQKVSAILADYGFVTLRLSDDWRGADFLALHISGRVIRVQLKSRLAFYEKYREKDLYVAFAAGDVWYLYPHDKLLVRILEATKIGNTPSWKDHGGYSFRHVPKAIQSFIEPYRISGDTKPIPE